MSNTEWSPLFKLNNGYVLWACNNHMCRNIWFQYDVNGKVICNGCQVIVPDAVVVESDKLMSMSQPETPLNERTVGKPLSEVQAGPTYDKSIRQHPDGFMDWLV